MDARGTHVIAAYPRLAESSRVGSARGPHDLQTSLIDRLVILYAFENLGGCSRTRTCDPLIKSHIRAPLPKPLTGHETRPRQDIIPAMPSDSESHPLISDDIGRH